MYTPYPNPPHPSLALRRYRHWDSLLVALIVYGVLATCVVGLQYVVAVAQWERCGATPGTAIVTSLLNGRPDALQCVASLTTP